MFFHSSGWRGFGSPETILPARCAFVADLADQLRAEQTFAVIFENNRVDLRQAATDAIDDARDLRRGRGADLLPVHANDLLVARDNPRFHDGLEIGVLDCVRGIDFLLGQQVAQLPPTAVRPDQAND